MINLDSILKSRDITLPTKVCIVKVTVFPVVMYRCESWTIKKAEHRRIDAFELWSWRRLLRDPWTARRSNQSILKGINPEYSLEGLMLKWGFPCSSVGKESACHAGDPGLDSRVRKIPWRRNWQPTPVFFPGKSHRQRSLEGSWRAGG